MKAGDVVKFSKKHTCRPGLDYSKDWIGIVIRVTITDVRVDAVDEIKIMWTIHGNSHISNYDEMWWNKLDYEPFEVVSEV
jgi:hypothetical protein